MASEAAGRLTRPRPAPPERSLLPLLLALLLLASLPAARADLGGVIAGAVKAVGSAVGSLFGGGGANEAGGAGGSVSVQQRLGPLVVKSALALQAAGAPPPPANASDAAWLPLGGGGGGVALTRAGPHSLLLAFKGEDTLAGTAPSDPVAFLGGFLPAAEAPSGLLCLLSEAIQGPDTQGALADAAALVMGGAPPLHVLCTGQGAVCGGLARLCATWAALQFPRANADAITFGASWEGFNPAFCWAFTQLAVLHYDWPFDSSHPALANATNANATALALGLEQLITGDVVRQAVDVPCLPPEQPPGVEPGTEAELDAFSPLEMPPSDCPPMLCKTRQALVAACLGYEPGSEQGLLPGLPVVRLRGDSGADAFVAWNATSATGWLVWEGSDERIDWVADAIVLLSDDFRPGNLSAVFPGVRVHRGFLAQGASLTTEPKSAAQNVTAALLALSGGTAPQHLIVAGHSLGGALAELSAVWAATVWPNASILVASTGAPKAGDAEWELLFRGVVGRSYRYVYGVDEVPSLPPFDSYRQVPLPIWLLDGDLALLQERPPLGLEELTWDDHHCDVTYVPALTNATALSVPSWLVSNATVMP
ncbi:alpha beta-hydrolase [Micractinium conductrix]|uniref:Alpha beta-hydrolase n=1 Tax=Micractinium conductrix TaxID=554055 RepID=A0A2P6V4F9_9CHLO|nr:alpha beta-hydrolase [Micractinium conductrix]|eukprot:PSC68968.1 alpha beta-hydrolase [Micractinium conductrix]